MTDAPTQPNGQSVTDVTLGYIQRDISKIEKNIADMKMDVVNRREFNDGLTALKKEVYDADKLIKEEFTSVVRGLQQDINLPKKIIFTAVGLILLAVFGALIAMVVK